MLHRIWMERFEVARDVASALEYLHKQDIVYRDLVRSRCLQGLARGHVLS